MKKMMVAITFLALQMTGISAQARVPGFPEFPAEPTGIVFCTAEAGVLIDEQGGCIGYSNGCEKAELLNLGYKELEEGDACRFEDEDDVSIIILESLADHPAF